MRDKGGRDLLRWVPGWGCPARGAWQEALLHPELAFGIIPQDTAGSEKALAAGVGSQRGVVQQLRYQAQEAGQWPTRDAALSPAGASPRIGTRSLALPQPEAALIHAGSSQEAD